jgi:nitrate reductase NapE component
LPSTCRRPWRGARPDLCRLRLAARAGRLYQRNGLTLSLALAAGLALFLVLAVALKGGLGAVAWRRGGGNFYASSRTT